MSHRRTSEDDLDDKNTEQYLKNNAIIFLEAAVNNCLDVFSAREVVMILDDQLDMVEEAIELERQDRKSWRFGKPSEDDDPDEPT